MSNRLTSREVLLGHLLLAEQLGIVSGLAKPSALHFISQQQKFISSKTRFYQAAFTAYWLNRLRPFYAANLVTATATAIALAGPTSSPAGITEISQALKAGLRVDELSAIIKQQCQEIN